LGKNKVNILAISDAVSQSRAFLITYPAQAQTTRLEGILSEYWATFEKRSSGWSATAVRVRCPPHGYFGLK